ncbi:reverse transcriptase N-terminal domain-containing protein [Limnoraphis robusta]|uniref:reverse transcriptase N-terminal domain-containing protein n=1 Tax=Limnoraphis robusta TaxID=1118279 RepID=UPI0009E5F460
MKTSKARGSSPMIEWKSIPWHKLERKVFKLQKRIYQASQRGNLTYSPFLKKGDSPSLTALDY